jgi:hypothetical protein
MIYLLSFKLPVLLLRASMKSTSADEIERGNL